MKSIYALAAALALSFTVPAIAQTASAPDSKPQTEVKSTDHAKDKSSEAKKPEKVAQKPAGSAETKTDASSTTSK